MSIMAMLRSDLFTGRTKSSEDCTGRIGRHPTTWYQGPKSDTMSLNVQNVKIIETKPKLGKSGGYLFSVLHEPIREEDKKNKELNGREVIVCGAHRE